MTRLDFDWSMETMRPFVGLVNKALGYPGSIFSLRVDKLLLPTPGPANCIYPAYFANCMSVLYT